MIEMFMLVITMSGEVTDRMGPMTEEFCNEARDEMLVVVKSHSTGNSVLVDLADIVDFACEPVEN